MDSTANNPTDERTIVISRTLDAPRELVFAAFTDPRHLSRFWRPSFTTVAACQVELRVGGAFRVEMRGPDGTRYPCTGTYREIVPPDKLVYTATTADDNPCGGGLPPRSLVTITFAAVGDRTRITIVAQLQTPADVAACVAGGYHQGWSESLDRLAELLAVHAR
jgi:uncharacterized protein YndB with AHSA1/START domain